MEIIWLENQNYDNNIEMIMNDIDIHDFDNDDYRENMIMMRYEAFPVNLESFFQASNSSFPKPYNSTPLSTPIIKFEIRYLC